MKELKDLEDEYSKFTTKSDFVKTLPDFICLLDIGIDEIEVHRESIINEIKINCKDQFAARIRNFFFGVFQIEEVDYYTTDNTILENTNSFITTYEQYYQQLKKIATEENYRELTRFVDFICNYYNNQIAYFDTQRDILEYQVKGFNLTDNRFQDLQEVLDDFVNKKIKQYTSEKAVEKQKKLC